MKRKGNIICIILLIIVLILFGVYKYYEGDLIQIEKDELDAMRKQYAQELKAEKEEKAAKEARYAEIAQEIPGIVCWGDDMTYGRGGIEKSYPRVLELLLEDNEYKIPVFNMGVSDEDSLTVLGRQGAIPYMVAEKFLLKGSSDLEEIKVVSLYKKAEVNPLMKKRNPGINPCSLSGIDGTLFGFVASNDLSKVDTFYFVRDHTGENINIPMGTEIITDGVNYKDYINILAIGENGGWNNNEELIEQNKRFVDFLKGSKNENSYLILGMSKGTREGVAEIEKLMSENFGEHYVNVREYLSTDAMADLELNPTDEDKEMMAKGQVPRSLVDDDNNLNDNAYEALGRLVYNKLVELNYIKK